MGSHTDVVVRIAEYARIGIDAFIFSGYPHLEELVWFGEGAIPIARVNAASSCIQWIVQSVRPNVASAQLLPAGHATVGSDRRPGEEGRIITG